MPSRWVQSSEVGEVLDLSKKDSKPGVTHVSSKRHLDFVVPAGEHCTGSSVGIVALREHGI
jgi:hypothetical protein